MNKSFGIVLLLVAVAHCINFRDQTTNLVLCSEQLNEYLSAVCGPSGFRNKIPQKRDSLDLFDYVDTENALRPYPLDTNALKGFYNQNINSLTQAIRRQRGVVDECCKRSCSLSVLHSYCGER